MTTTTTTTTTTETPTFDEAATLALLRQVVEEKGASTTAECFYTTAGRDGKELEYGVAAEPCCIVGQVVFKAAGADGLSMLTERRSAQGNKGILEGLGFTGHAVGVLIAAQREQDLGDTWGEALKSATEWLRRTHS